VTLSEARLSYLSHALLKAVTADKLGRVRNERLFLNEAKLGLTDAFSLEGRLDQLARSRMPKRVVPGSRRVGRPLTAGTTKRNAKARPVKLRARKLRAKTEEPTAEKRSRWPTGFWGHRRAPARAARETARAPEN
jgi:hypothetical protein